MNFNVTTVLDYLNADVVERYVYDPYGKPTIYNYAGTAIDWEDSYKNEILYCGYRYNPETGDYHVRNRMYHPVVGRWLQRDPAGHQDGMNLYQYVRSMPATETDPTGLILPAELMRGRDRFDPPANPWRWRYSDPYSAPPPPPPPDETKKYEGRYSLDTLKVDLGKIVKMEFDTRGRIEGAEFDLPEVKIPPVAVPVGIFKIQATVVGKVKCGRCCNVDKGGRRTGKMGWRVVVGGQLDVRLAVGFEISALEAEKAAGADPKAIEALFLRSAVSFNHKVDSMPDCVDHPIKARLSLGGGIEASLGFYIKATGQVGHCDIPGGCQWDFGKLAVETGFQWKASLLAFAVGSAALSTEWAFPE